MENRSRAPVWQRAISALLALGGIWALVSRSLDGELGTWVELGVILTALYGAYLFGYFALRGRLPGVLAGKRGARRPSVSSPVKQTLRK